MDLRKVFDQTVRDLKRELNRNVLKVPEIEQKVLDATSNEPWGPHGTAMAELAQATRNYNDYQMIMSILWKRLADTGKNWRHVYKSLTVFDYFVAHGAERVIDELREHVFQIQGLLDFQYVEPTGKDQGINVRKKAQTLVALLNDKEKIREVRQKAAANRDKYQGYSSTGGVHKPSFSSSGGGGFSDWKSNTNGRGYSDWDDDRNSRKGPNASREGRYSTAFNDDEHYDDDHDKSYKTKATFEDSQKDSKSLNQKSSSTATSTVTETDEDDFDPRATSLPRAKPAPAAAAAPPPLPPEVDFFGIDFLSTPSTVDPFAPVAAPTSAATTAPVATVAPTAATDLFASAEFSDPLGSNNDFGAFTSAPTPATSSGGDFFAADPFGQLSDLQFESKAASKPVELDTSSTSFNAFGDVKTSQPAAAPPPSVPSFQTKSSVWADSLASGLIDLNITVPKSTTALADVGVQSSGLTSDWYLDDSRTGLKGKAMGSGSGVGLAGASSLASSNTDLNGFGFDYSATESNKSAPSQRKQNEPLGFGTAGSHAFFNTGLNSSQSSQPDDFAIFR